MQNQLVPEIKKSNEWMNCFSDLLTGVIVPDAPKMKIAVALLHLCNEHHQGIDLLVSNGVNGSAFALFRSQFEAYIRAIWLYHCSQEQQFSDFMADKQIPPIKTLIENIEQLNDYKSKTLSSTHEKLYKSMCSFAHGGVTQVNARLRNGQIDESYLPEQIIDLIRTSAILSFMAGAGIAQLVGNQELANKLSAKFSEIYDA